MSKKKKLVRVELRKNRGKPPRGNDLTRSYAENAALAEDGHLCERVRAKGDASRYRTVVEGESPTEGDLIRGRVIRVHGLASIAPRARSRICPKG